MRVGWIGFGEMGSRIVQRLVNQGYSVIGWNRTRSKAAALDLEALEVVDSPREVAERTHAIFSMVTNAIAVEKVLQGEEGILAGLQEGAILVEMSTIDPGIARSLATAVRQAGGHMLDCPVSGGVSAVSTGDLSLMVGGDRETVEKIRPVLDSIGKRVTHVGGHGQALIMKIAINLSLAVQMIAFSEGVVLAEKHGIEREKAVDALLNSAVASPMLRHRGPAVLPGDLPDPAWFDCEMMQKDLVLALDLGRKRMVPLPSTSLANDWMTACRGYGVGHHDFSVVFHVLGRLAGLTGGL